MLRARKSHIFTKQKHGHYVEPSWCSRRLFEVETFKGVIWDPACGWGTILAEAHRAGYSVAGSDQFTRWKAGRVKLAEEIRLFKLEFLYSDISRLWGAPFSVVCNPPFDHVEEFCREALRWPSVDKVAMICLVRRLNAARWLQDLPLRRVWLLTPRPSMPPGKWIAAGNKPGGGKQDFCWLVFEPGFKGKPTMGWLHRDEGGKKESSGLEFKGGYDGDDAVDRDPGRELSRGSG